MNPYRITATLTSSLAAGGYLAALLAAIDPRSPGWGIALFFGIAVILTALSWWASRCYLAS